MSYQNLGYRTSCDIHATELHEYLRLSGGCIHCVVPLDVSPSATSREHAIIYEYSLGPLL